MYKILVRPELDKKLNKLSKKNPKHFRIITKKSEEISMDPHCYKNLRAPLNHWKRVHIDRHFVLIFSIDEENNAIILERYEHHDKVYNV